MAESARQELAGTEARVTLVSPGAADTAFWDAAPDMQMLSADDVADVVSSACSGQNLRAPARNPR